MEERWQTTKNKSNGNGIRKGFFPAHNLCMSQKQQTTNDGSTKKRGGGKTDGALRIESCKQGVPKEKMI